MMVRLPLFVLFAAALTVESATGDRTLQNDVILREALGRPFQLGQLYDLRDDKAIPGFSLWTTDHIKSSLNILKMPFNSFEVGTSNTIEEKMNMMGVGGDLKASLVSGLVDVGGSAKYINNKRANTEQASVTLRYESHDRYEQLTMAHLESVDFKDIFDKDLATHVVTGILYGNKAFFDFKHDVGDGESVGEISATLKTVIAAVPNIKGDINGRGNFTDKEKKCANNMKVSFNGDFYLENLPVSYQEAIEVYNQLPSKKKEPVALQIYLSPLSQLDKTAERVVRRVPLDLIDQSAEIIKDLEDYGLLLKDMETFPNVGTHFEGIPQLLSRYQNSLNTYTLIIREKLKEAIPKVRTAGSEDDLLNLQKVLKDHADSPFGIGSPPINSWKEKRNDMKVVDTYISLVEGVPYLSDPGDLEVELVKNKKVAVLAFKLRSSDPCIEALELYCTMKKSESNINIGPQISEATKKCASEKWIFSDPNTKSQIRTSIINFIELMRASKDADIKFYSTTQAVMVNSKLEPGAYIQVFNEGTNVIEDLKVPSVPIGIRATKASRPRKDSSTLIVRVEWGAPVQNPGSVKGYMVDTYIYFEGAKSLVSTLKVDTNEVNISNLNLWGKYEIRVRPILIMGFGPQATSTRYIIPAEYEVGNDGDCTTSEQYASFGDQGFVCTTTEGNQLILRSGNARGSMTNEPKYNCDGDLKMQTKDLNDCSRKKEEILQIMREKEAEVKVITAKTEECAQIIMDNGRKLSNPDVMSNLKVKDSLFNDILRRCYYGKPPF